MKRLAILALFLLVPSAIAQSPEARARAALARARAALALAAAQESAYCPACGEFVCPCGCDFTTGKGCLCGQKKAHEHPRTMKADDGGADWTWDPVRGDWWRKVVAPAAAEMRTPPAAVPFSYPAFAPPPLLAPLAPYPRMRMFGGFGRGGGGC